MLFALLALVRSEEDVCGLLPETLKEMNCFLCMSRPGCVFVRKEKLCIAANSTEIEKYQEADKTLKLDAECARDLGGDAIPSVRYAIGICVVVAAVIIDLSVRFLSVRQTRKDAYEQQILQ